MATDRFDPRTLATLERRTRHALTLADLAGHPIEFAGVMTVFDDTRAYTGPQSDWIIAPAAHDPQLATGQLPIPRTEHNQLQVLADAGLPFDRLYLAHELPKGRLQLAAPSDKAPEAHVVPTDPSAILDPASARAALGTAPPPEDTRALSERLGAAADLTRRLLAAAVPILATATVASAALARTGARALSQLDPMVFGVIPADRQDRPDQPGAFFVLAHWT